MCKSDMKYFTDDGLLHTKRNYERLLLDYKPEHYNGLSEDQLRAEYCLVLLEIYRRKYNAKLCVAV